MNMYLVNVQYFEGVRLYDLSIILSASNPKKAEKKALKKYGLLENDVLQINSSFLRKSKIFNFLESFNSLFYGVLCFCFSIYVIAKIFTFFADYLISLTNNSI